MNRSRSGLPILLSLLVGCATTSATPGPALTGGSGPVRWEVVNVGRVDSSSGSRSRWSYTIVLRETSGTAVQFERVVRSSHTGASTILVGGAPRTDVFNRRLPAGGELRYHAWDSWGWNSSAGPQFGGISRLGGLTVERRFIGKDARGDSVTITVRVMLDRSFGQLSRRSILPDMPLPSSRMLEPGELQKLAGRWEGYYEVADFRVPLEAVVSQDGSADIGENDPVTNRFRAVLSVRDGRVWFAARETGTLTLHEGDGKRVLVSCLGRT